MHILHAGLHSRLLTKHVLHAHTWLHVLPLIKHVLHVLMDSSDLAQHTFHIGMHVLLLIEDTSVLLWLLVLLLVLLLLSMVLR